MTAHTFDIPTFETERLILRPNRADDFDAYAAFYADDRAQYRGGPLHRLGAYRIFAQEVGHWALRGYGVWALEEKATGTYCGQVGPYFPEGWPEAEISWLLMNGFEGQGYAIEAARFARDYAYGTLGWTTAISLISKGNVPSSRLAERLGATFEKEIDFFGELALVYRHPAPEGLA